MTAWVYYSITDYTRELLREYIHVYTKNILQVYKLFTLPYPPAQNHARDAVEMNTLT